MSILLPWLSVAYASRLAGWHVGAEQGLPLGHAVVAAEDAAGFLWIGNQSGLARYDGDRFRSIGTDVLYSTVNDLAPLPDGDLLVVADSGLYRVHGDTVRKVEVPAGGEWGWPQACVRDGVAWVSYGRALYRADVGDTLVFAKVEVPFRAHGVSCDGGTFAKAGPEAWELGPDGWKRLLHLDVSSVQQILGTADGERWVLPWTGPLQRIRDGWKVPLTDHSRNQGLVERYGAVWATSGDLLARVDPSGRVDRWGLEEDFRGLPDLYVDREGDLWTVSDDGLVRFPEPDTVELFPEDGLKPAGQLWLRSDGPWAWASGWAGVSRIDPGPGPDRRVVADPTWPRMGGPICPTSDGAWAVALDERGTELVRIRSGIPEEVALLEAGPAGGSCAVGRDGQVWVETNQSAVLWRVVDGRPVRSGIAMPAVHGGEMLHGLDGELWLVDDETVCRLDGDRWACTEIPGAREIADLLKVDGAVWVGTHFKGVVAIENGQARILGLPPDPTPGSMRVTGMAPSPRGGIWLAGVGRMERARWDEVHGWEVLERLEPWQGMADTTAANLLEQADGTLMATQAGVLVVPPQVRERTLQPPRLVLLHADNDGDPLPTEDAVVPWRRSRVNLQFAAPTYHDRTGLRLRYRAKDDDPFVETHLLELSFANLSPQRYQVTAQASLDGVRWSEPVRVGFTVEAPPWQRWWAVAGAAMALVGVGYGLHRLRLARELALERERLRIALDLHDEVGSALGTVKLAAGMLKLGAIGETQRQELADRLAKQSGVVISALTDIVWSLRAGPTDPAALLTHLEDRARGLLGPDTQLVVLRPNAWPSTRFRPEVARAVLHVGLEALHNASKHAQAEVIVLRLAPVGRAGWILEVADDGVGLRAGSAPRPGGGSGLDGMRRRAERIGAQLEIGSDTEGTRVVMTFGAR